MACAVAPRLSGVHAKVLTNMHRIFVLAVLAAIVGVAALTPESSQCVGDECETDETFEFSFKKKNQATSKENGRQKKQKQQKQKQQKQKQHKQKKKQTKQKKQKKQKKPVIEHPHFNERTRAKYNKWEKIMKEKGFHRRSTKQ